MLPGWSQSVIPKGVEWFANDHFVVQTKDYQTMIGMEKKAWEAFTLKVSEPDFSEQPLLSFKIKSTEDITLRVDAIDQSMQPKTTVPICHKVVNFGEFTRLTYDFSSLISEMDEENISHFHFYVNPGLVHTGTIWIKDIVFHPPVTKTFVKPSKLTISPNPVTDQICIESEAWLFDAMEIYDYTGRTMLLRHFNETRVYSAPLTTLPEGIFRLVLFYQGRPMEATTIVK